MLVRDLAGLLHQYVITNKSYLLIYSELCHIMTSGSLLPCIIRAGAITRITYLSRIDAAPQGDGHFFCSHLATLSFLLNPNLKLQFNLNQHIPIIIGFRDRFALTRVYFSRC
jgi:hypothetical protein